MTDALQDRAAELTDRIASLRNQRGIATLCGESFDHEAIAQAEAELEALGEAEAEAVRRQRIAASASAGEHRASLKVELLRLEAERIAAVGRAETAMRALVNALGATLTVANRMRSIVSQLEKGPPDAIAAHTLIDRLSMRIVAVLGRFSPGGFGKVGYWQTIYSPDDDWTKAETAIGAELKTLTKGS